ncbi:MAG: TIGR03936 family radical SAM-associated protein [Clostridium sp.]|jgi:radical SAM-linked protein|nr:TIGR03936 family radical SAM-associated protein [Clostridium sp.]
MKIRIKFRKQGAVKFVGHLDIMRYFQKVMRRADVDIRYSEGFSPHQIMSFAAPLGVGLTSNGEYVDIEVNSTESSEEMVRRINAVNVEGISVTSYRKLPDSAKNAMSLVAAADYTMWFKDGYEPEDENGFWTGLSRFLEQPSIPIVKKTKKGVKEMDLKPYLYGISIESPLKETSWKEMASDSPERQGAGRIFMKLSAGSSVNIRPEQVIGAYYESLGQEYPTFAFQIQREEVYGDQGSDSCHRFIPLEEYGEEIIE